MKFQSVNPLKSKRKTPCEESNGSVISNRFEFPMKPFKGTKSHLQKYEDSTKISSSQNRRKADVGSANELHFQKEKKLKYDPLKVMSKLEQFSDVWNDCPDVENPKISFEVISNHKNETEEYNKAKHFEHRNKRQRESEESKWTASNDSGKRQNFEEKSTQEMSDHYHNSYGAKSKTLDIEHSKIHKLKNKVVEDNHIGKYDSNVAEIKRKKAVQEQIQLHADQKNIIKKALSSTDGKQQVNKKIVFSDVEDNGESQTQVISTNNKTKTQNLFDDDDSSEAVFELKVNSQFEGKKGQKLLELQSKFASDSRFTLDSRFNDSESENEKDEAPSKDVDINEEKKKQLEILESIVKQPIRPLSERRKVSGKKYDEALMVRFDPTREDHQKYLLKSQETKQEKELKVKSKISKKERKSLTNIQEIKPEVSSEKVYAVKEDLKEVLKKETKSEFSLLKLFGPKEEDSNMQQEGSENIKKLKYATKNPFRYDSSESEPEDEDIKAKEQEKDKIAAKTSLPSWRTTFFFTENDSRLKEADEFLKGPEEPEDDQEFVEKRKMLKDFIRHKLKNSSRKKDPFKKKLGGVKKKIFHKKKGK